MPINKGYLTAKTDKASDEVYTPMYAVTPIIKHLKNKKENATVWCPFDEEDSNYVIGLKNAGFKVIATHIKNNQNFFEYEPDEEYDFIVSNPPFSIKDDILKRLSDIGKTKEEKLSPILPSSILVASTLNMRAIFSSSYSPHQSPLVSTSTITIFLFLIKSFIIPTYIP